MPAEAASPVSVKRACPYSCVVGRHHGCFHQVETLQRRLGDALRRLPALDAALDDLEGVDRMLVVVLRVLLEPPAPPRPDLLVLREPAQRFLRDLLRHALDRVVGRRHRRAERGVTAYLVEVAVKL